MPSPPSESSSHSTQEYKDRSSQGSYKPFRESLHLIPTPVDDKRVRKRFDPLIMRLPVVIGTPLLMIGLGVALEIALMVSYRDGGFSVPRDNVVSFVSAQFLLAFFPTLFVIPVAFLWRELDWHVRWYQPYVILSNGNAKAEESLLLDYIALGPFLSLFRSLMFRHRIVFWSALTASATYILQPLAGSIFQIRQIGQTEADTATSIRAIGLAPDINELNAFVAAAGFAEAAAFHNLTDPPFVRGGWATAEFVFPTAPHLNGTVAVNTTGIQTNLQCDNGVDTRIIQNGPSNFTIDSISPQGCVTTAQFDPSVATQQYGVRHAYCLDAPLDIEFRPVMFWYFLQGENGNSPSAKAVFCSAALAAMNVQATADLSSGDLVDVIRYGVFEEENNVTGGDLAGKAFNGVLFTPSPNPFIQARATAINSAIPSAAYRLAAASSIGLQGTFDLPNGFLDITTKIYRQHLAISAKSIYFVPTSVELPAKLTALAPRLWIDPLPAHLLACILILIGLTGVFIHIFNRRQRRNLYLSSPPGSIATTVSLTSRSGFGELLLPYDDPKTIEAKLREFRFRLDRRTGAIVADEDFGGRMVAGKRDSGSASRGGGGRDEAMQTLLGGHSVVPSATANSSHTALAAAVGYEPWRQPPVKTAYDP